MTRRFHSAAAAAVLLAVVLVAGVAGYVTGGDGRDSPPAPAAPARQEGLRGVVREVSAGRLSLTTDAGAVDLDLTASTSYEALRPARLDSLSAGDWVNAGAVPHAQTVYALLGLVVIPGNRVMAPR